jgi:predicted nucleic acid-binding protein
MRLDPKDHAAEWFARLATLQQGYYYPWRPNLAPRHGEDTFRQLMFEHLKPELDVMDVACAQGDRTTAGRGGVAPAQLVGFRHARAVSDSQGSDRLHFEEFFAAATILPLAQPVLDQAVKLRRQRRMTLGDALVAATCLVYGLALVTHNTADFNGIPGLQVLDPLAVP